MRIPEQEMTLRDLAQVLRRRSVLLCAIALGVFVFSIMLWWFTPRQYEAGATLRVRSGRGNSVNSMLTGISGTQDVPADALSADLELQSQAALLQSNSLALRTIHKLNLENKPPFRAARGDQIKQLGLFEKKLTVKPVGGTSMIQVSYLDRDPEIAASVVNDLLQELSDQDAEQQEHSSEAATRALRNQLSDLKQRSEELQVRVAAMQRSSGIYSAGTTDNEGRPQAYSAILAQFEHAATVLGSADENRILKQGIVEAARSGNAELLSSLAGNGPGSAGTGTTLSSLQALRAQQATLQGQLNQMQVKFGAAYPKVAETSANLMAINAAINAETERVAQRAETDFQVADRTYRMAKGDYERQKMQADALNDRAISYVMTRQEADETRGLYEDLLKRLKEAGIFEALHASTVEVTDPALLPSEPAKPSMVVFLGGGLAAGLFLGTIVALLLELLGDKVHSADDFRILGVPLSDVLPGAAGVLRRGQVQTAREASLRSLCATVLRSVTDAEPVVVLMAEISGATADWKLPFSVAQNLAARGRRVHLVQVDPGMPLEASALKPATRSGVNSAITSAPPRTLLDSISPKALPSGEQKLNVLVSDAHENEILFLSDAVERRRLVDTWSKNHDIVIVQTAPILPFADSHVLLGEVDLVLLTAVLGETSRTAVARAQEVLQAHGAKRVVVLAEEGRTRGAYEDFYGISLGNARFA